MKDPYLESILELLEDEEFMKRYREKVANGTHLITDQQLRASGALDVPPEWRKSLSARLKPQQRDLFSGLAADDEPGPDDEEGEEAEHEES